MSGARAGFGGRRLVTSAVGELRAGHAVVIIDDVGPWGGGDLVFAAELASTALMSFMIRHTSGFVCVSLPDFDAERLDLPAIGSDRRGPGYAVSVDALADGTGVSAADRANTVRQLADALAPPDAFTRPGHVVPVRVRPGGVLRSAGRAEAAHDLAVLADLRPVCATAALVSEMDPVSMAGAAELNAFADTHGLAITSISEVRDAAERWWKSVRPSAS